jgi:DNA-binding CsgD family transcriptional regulator
VRLGPGPLRVWIEGYGDEAEELRSRSETEGLVLVEEAEEADLIAHPANPQRAGGERSAPALSPREMEILDYLADGWSNAEIASALRIGSRTVRFHLEGIYAKLGVSRRGEAVREAVGLGLVHFQV